MSNQMEEIPEDVKKAAERAMEGWLANLNAVYRPGLHDQTHYMRRWVTDAIMAERERCAKVVERHRPDASFDDSSAGYMERHALLSNVATAIRTPSP